MIDPPAADPGLTPGRRHHWVATEIVVVGGAAFIQVFGTAMAAQHQTGRSISAVGYLLLVLGVAALPFRRRWPVEVLAFTFATTLAYWCIGDARGPAFASLIVALFQCVLDGHRRAAITSVVLGFVLFPWLPFWVGQESEPAFGAMLALAAWLTALVSISEVVRGRRARALEAEQLRAEELRRRIADERLRIARELHDAVAHSMSLINIQAGVALHLEDERPEQMRSALETIKAASKEALVELRSILGVLRQVDEDAPRAPTPGLGQVEELVAGATAAGLHVRVEVDGDLPSLPRPVDLAAYRIIQESLTNVARHSDRPEATVRINTADHELRLEVLDEGSGRSRDAELPSGGNGIAGMRERAAAVGGRLEAGRRPGRGFAVRASLPLEVDA
jgi:signal transduction histidine kinase